MEEKGFGAGLQASIPTALGYISIGLACGVLGASAGLSPLDMGLMSALAYGGSGQFAMIAMMAAGAPILSIVATVFFINLRHFLMGLHVTTMFKKTSFWQNIGMASLLTDETYGVLLGQYVHDKEIKSSWMYGNVLLAYGAWIVATIFGALLGSLIPNPEGLGLDFALIAMFVGIFTGQLSAMMRNLPLAKIGLILLTVLLAYSLLATILSSYFAVLGATLLACLVGVMIDEE